MDREIDSLLRTTKDSVVAFILLACSMHVYAAWDVPIDTPDNVYGYASFQWIGNHMYHTGADIGGWDDLEKTPVKAAESGDVVSVWGLAPGGSDELPNSYCDDGNPDTDDGNEQIRRWNDDGDGIFVESELSDETDLTSTDKGKVLATCTGRNKSNHGFGMAVIIEHSDGTFSLYAHLSAIRKSIWEEVVTNGSVFVSKGEAVGVVGHSAKLKLNADFSPHVHFEVKKDNTLGTPDTDTDYWGYTPDIPNAYGYIDPESKLSPPPAATLVATVVRVVENEAELASYPTGDVARGVRIQSSPGTVYHTLGWTGKDQRFYSDQQATDSGGRTWYRIHLPSDVKNYPSSAPVPVAGWIASKTGDGTVLVKEDAEPASTLEVVNDDGIGWKLRRDPVVTPCNSTKCVQVVKSWKDIGGIEHFNYLNVHAWNGSRFIRRSTKEEDGETWHEVYLPKIYFDNPASACPSAPANDQCVGDITSAWLSDDAVKIVDAPNVQDISPPELQAIELSPESIDVTSGSATVSVTATIRDDLSGLDRGSVTIYSPSLSQSKSFSLHSSNRTSGSALDGVYQSSVTFPQFSEAGDWEVRNVSLADNTTNSKYYGVSELQSYGALTVSVISEEDTTSPIITSVEVEPSTVDASSGDATVTLRTAITDDRAGLRYATYHFYSPSRKQYRTGSVSAYYRIAGDALDGVYQSTVTFPQYSESGDWILNNVNLTDNADNRWYVSSQDLDAMNISAGFTMISNPEDTQPPAIEGLAITPDTINTILNSASTTFNLDVTDKLSGFTSGYIFVQSPSGKQNHVISLGSYYRTAGDAQDGQYERTTDFPRYSEFGEWKVQSVYLVDRATNRMSVPMRDLESAGLPTSLYIEGIIDSGSFTVSPAGGEFTVADGNLNLYFPSNALTQDTTISTTSVGRFDPVEILTALGRSLGRSIAEYVFQPDGLSFLLPITVELTVDVTSLSDIQRGLLDMYLHTDTDDDGSLDTFVPLDSGEVVSVSTTENPDGTTDMTFVANLEHFSTYAVILPIEEVDTTPPELEISVPQANIILQDAVTVVAEVTDQSNIDSMSFTVREAGGDQGVDIGYEGVPGTRNAGTDDWVMPLQSTTLVDGNYMVFAEAMDNYGNEGVSEIVPFSIRNWSLLESLPKSRTYRAGRTVPVKFDLHVSSAVNPATPFVRNEELEVRIYATFGEQLLQISRFGATSKDYRIDPDARIYITNFKTGRLPAEYTVEVWRSSNDFLIGSFTFETTRK